jgi:hypothetical protein
MSIYNRAEIVHRTFLRRVGAGDFPEPASPAGWTDTGLTKEEIIELLESQIISRHLDLAARKLKTRNQCYYTIGSAGHEGNAVFGKIFRTTNLAYFATGVIYMINKIFNRIFGGKDRPSKTKAVDSVSYQEFEIRPAPVKEASGWRISGTIVKEVDGATREHVFIRADSCADLESAVTLTVRKARQLIDEQGEKIFR